MYHNASTMIRSTRSPFVRMLGRRNYRYFFLFLFLLCLHIVFLFTFCLYYILNDRHHRIITPDRLPVSSHSLSLTQPDDFGTAYGSRTTFVGFSDYRFILCIAMLVLLSLVTIPIGGLTAFHVYLISQGRTTNEQVTGKFRIQNDVFNRGCCMNCSYTFCQPLYPRSKTPKTKRYNADLFEQMAYGKIKFGLPSNGLDEELKKIAYEETDAIHDMPDIHLSLMNEKSKRDWSTRETRSNIKRIDIFSSSSQSFCRRHSTAGESLFHANR